MGSRRQSTSSGSASQAGLPSSSSQERRRTPSPPPSRIVVYTPTPGDPIDETVTDYFVPLSGRPTARSRTSRRPSYGSVASSTRGPIHDGSSDNELRAPSIRLRRSVTSIRSRGDEQQLSEQPPPNPENNNDVRRGRPRSLSQPIPGSPLADNPEFARSSRRIPQTRGVALPRLTEEGGRPNLADLALVRRSHSISPSRSLPEQTHRPTIEADESRGRTQRTSIFSRVFWPRTDNSPKEAGQQEHEGEYSEELVSWLTAIDPEVQTLSTLTNVQNSLFVPDLGSWVNRRPTYVLSDYDREPSLTTETTEEEGRQTAIQEEAEEQSAPTPLQGVSTISSRLTDSHYATLPHGYTLDGWTAAEKMELDDHVRHMLHSRRSKFKQRLKGFGQYVRRPLGFFVTLYAVLITLFGLAWVLFLIGWIYVGEKQVYSIHIIDSVLVALFAIMGDGLAPFRAVDTYHMIFVARYSRKINKGEKGENSSGEAPIAPLDQNGIPPGNISSDVESQKGGVTASQALHQDTTSPWGHFTGGSPEIRASNPDDQNCQPLDLEDKPLPGENQDEGSIGYPLTYAQQRILRHHQKKLSNSHSFYKPQETFTHNPFPLNYLIAIVILLDCHSCLQIALGACTWGIDYHTRPIAITTVILCVSITCNITAGVLISVGDRKTRKKDIMELLARQALTGDAIKHVVGKRKKVKKEARLARKSKEQSISPEQESG